MVRLLLSLWEKINRRKRIKKLQPIIDGFNPLLGDKAGEECWMLAFSLALEELPEYILNWVIPFKYFCYVDYYEYWIDKNLTVRDLLQLGLEHKIIEPVKKHSYSFIWGTKLTFDRILSRIELIPDN